MINVGGGGGDGGDFVFAAFFMSKNNSMVLFCDVYRLFMYKKIASLVLGSVY